MSREEQELSNLCRLIKEYVKKDDWAACMEEIPQYMEMYPDSAVPHNLMGIVLEKQGKHPEAMKHFRAAWSLDSTFVPANRNMDAYSIYDRKGEVEPAYTMEDCMPKREPGIVQKTSFFLKSLLTVHQKKAGAA
ncbi:hypothetical protein HMPREF0980_01060 [Dorea sp. D27]|nr:hypothetical protein HMPREF0980_01060 [Dorea sp. D27]